MACCSAAASRALVDDHCPRSTRTTSPPRGTTQDVLGRVRRPICLAGVPPVANERLRDAMLSRGVTVDHAADITGVDPKSVERWITTDRTPYARHRRRLATLLGEDESYLWPAAVKAERRTVTASAEIVALYPHRNVIPADVWERLINAATDRIDILVHSGQFLVERSNFIETLSAKAAQGVTVRIAFGDPDSCAVELRSAEEGLGPGVLGARIRYALVPYTPLVGVAGVEMRFHSSTLYNSLFRFDDELIVNAHVFGVPGPHAPALHLKKLGAGDLFDLYSRSFVGVWKLARPAIW